MPTSVGMLPGPAAAARPSAVPATGTTQKYPPTAAPPRRPPPSRPTNADGRPAPEALNKAPTFACFSCCSGVEIRGACVRLVMLVWGGGGSRLATAAPLSLLSFLLQQADVTRHLLPYRALGRVDVHWPMPPHLPPSLHIAADRRAWVVEMCQLPRARVSCGASPSFTPPAATVRPYARAPSHRVTACIAPPSSPLPWPQAAARPLRRRHPCFACGRPGSPREPVSKCSMGSCGRHYHWRCLTASPLARVAASGKSAKCQLHYCMACGGSGNAVPMVQCMMCPSAYHARCRPPGTRVVSKKFVLCPRCSTRDPNSTGPSA